MDWKARVISLLRSGEPSQPSNYRPISILPVLSKPLEKHINKHLSKHLETYDFHHTNQSDSGKTFHAKLLSLVLLINGYTMSMRTNSQVHWFFVCLFVCFVFVFILLLLLLFLILQGPLALLILTYFTGSCSYMGFQISVINKQLPF